ncbi:sulfatase-like hydrolase/transferase [Planctomycetota bacterium]
MDQPNILIFMTDHQRGDTVLPENPTLTPNVDRLAAEGATFAENYCPSPHCCPARATFHSGLYPQQTGIWNNVCNNQALQTSLNDGVRLWAEDLADAGYTQSYIGKWHVNADERPSQRGWQRDEYATGLPGTLHGQTWERFRQLAADPPSAETGDGRIIRPGWPGYKAYNEVNEEDHGDAGKVNQALEELDILVKGDGPWSLCVNTSGPHDPYVVPQKYLDMYDPEDTELPPSFRDDLTDKPGIYRRQREQIWGQMSEQEYREAVRHFRAYCTFMDDLFGRVLDRLDASGQKDNTLVLYCSDHGDYCGDHGLFAKGIASFRGAYHVPAIIRWPAGIENPGRKIDELVSLADFGPTFLEAAGISVDREFAGTSLMPFLKNDAPENWREDLLMQCNGVELYYTQRILQTKAHKYVFNGFDFDELYDLKKDPHEMVNVSEQKEYEAVKRDLVKRMWRNMKAVDDSAHNAYITVALAPYGPALAFEE